MKKRFLLAGITAALCASAVALSGCSITTGITYSNADKYTAGGTTVTGTVTKLDIDWVDGSVDVAYGDVAGVTFSETSSVTLDKRETVHYWLEDTTLHIKFAQSKGGIYLNGYPEKALTVTLPAELQLTELDIAVVDADVAIDNVAANDVEIETVGGEVNAYLVGTTRELSVYTAGGDITVNANDVTEFEIETVGAEVYLESVTAPRSGSFDATGGSFTLALYDDITGFTFEMEGVVGDFNSEFETIKRGDSYVYGDGGNEYEAETVGGNVTVLKKTK